MCQGTINHGTCAGELSPRTIRRKSRRLMLFVSILALAGCTTTQISPNAAEYGMAGLPCVKGECARPPSCPAPLVSSPEVSSPDLCALWERLAKANDRALNISRISKTFTLDPEKSSDSYWSPADDRGPRAPQVCLAMSGGGLRSAAVNIGVLSGLHALDASGPVLERIDIMSGVSGGSSALAWYFTQHWDRVQNGKEPHGEIDRRRFDERLFDETGEYQQYLRNNYVTFTNVEYGAGVAINLAAAPVNFLLNGVFGWHTNTSPMRGWYESRLSKTFQHVRVDGGTWVVADPPMHDLARLSGKPHGLPWPIVNATALVENDLHHYGARLGNVIFQFTPKRFGSDAFGRHNYLTNAGELSDEGDFTLGRVVSIASAAFDGSSLVAGPSQSTLWSLLNFDTGMYVDNPNVSPQTRRWHRLLPWPTYYFDNYLRDVKGTDIYLTDGGHSENLGAYALVTRGCARIIVVDAEHDPTYVFDAYRRLKQGLRSEMGVTFAVDEIDRKFLPLPPGKPKPVSVDDPRWTKAATTPVMKGTIAAIPFGASIEAPPSIPVLYIKMAYHANPLEGSDVGAAWETELDKTVCPSGGPVTEACKAFQRRQRSIREAFDKQRSLPCTFNPSTSDYGKIFERCPFPQRSTKVQDYSPTDYVAWRDLGRLLIDGHEKIIRDFLNTNP